MADNTLRATNKTKKFEIVLNTGGGTLPPLLQPATSEEQTAYQEAGAAVARGSIEEARKILETAGFLIIDEDK